MPIHAATGVRPSSYDEQGQGLWLAVRAAAATHAAIAIDPRHLGVRIGFTSVLPTWGSAMTHHPHLRIIAPGAGPGDADQHRSDGRVSAHPRC